MPDRALPDPVAMRRARTGWGVRSIYAFAVGILALGIIWIGVKPYIYTATPGSVTAPRYVVSTPYESRVVEIYVQPGSRVWEGERLAKVRAPAIDSLRANLVMGLAEQTNILADLRIRLSVAEASHPSAAKRLERSRLNLDRLGVVACPATSNFCSDIYRENALASETIAKLDAEVIEIRSQIEEIARARQAISDLYDAVVMSYAGGDQVSWVNGMVGPDIVQPGQSVSAGDAIISVYDTDRMYIEWVLDGSRIRQPQDR